MTPSAPNSRLSRRRYQFRNGLLEEAQPLELTRGSFSQMREDFLEYCRGMRSYLKRLANTAPADESECPFCSLRLDENQRAYVSQNGMHPFVDHPEAHVQLWKEGVIVTSNSMGWHLISELVIPRTHVTDFVSTLACSRKPLETALSRWYVHRLALRKVLSDDVDVYHGIVINQKAGQSVAHSHYHCYTTVHPLIPLGAWLQLPAVGRLETLPAFDIRADLRDHPGLVGISRLDKFPENVPDYLGIVGAMLSIADAFRQVQEDIYGSEIPASTGWFLTWPASRCLIHATVPLARYGTLQVFQGDRFLKFRPDIVLASLKDALGSVEVTAY